MVSSILGGMAGGATVAITIKAIDEFTKPLKSAEKGLGGFTSMASVATTGAAALAVGLGALGAGMIAVGKSSLDASLQMQPIREGFNNLTEDSENFLKTLNKVTKGTVSDFDLMASSNKALLLGLDQDALPSLFENAAIVGRAAGRSTKEAIDDITVGIGRQSRMILDNLGIIIKQSDVIRAAVKNNEALKDRVEQLDNSLAKGTLSQVRYDELIKEMADGLTEAEMKAGFAQAAIESLNSKAADLGGNLSVDATTSLQQLNSAFQNMKVEIGDQLLPVLGEFINTFMTQIYPTLQPLIPLIGEQLAKALKLLTEILISAGPHIVEFIKFFLQATSAALQFADLTKGVVMVAINRFINGLTAVSFLLKEIFDYFTRVTERASSFASSIGNVVSSVGRFMGGKSSTMKVGDAIIRPNGQVIETSPQDTLIATKNPNALGRGGVTLIVEGNMIGLNEEDVARRLNDYLASRISL